jgi:hypothetical protein
MKLKGDNGIMGKWESGRFESDGGKRQEERL